MKISKQKGSTLVEVIVAMAIAVIVSTIAISVCNMAIAFGENNKVKNFFMVEAQNFVQAYYLGGDDYKSAMNMLTGNECEFGENVTIKYSADLSVTNDESAKYSVQVVFGENFSVQCYTQNSKLIYQVEA